MPYFYLSSQIDNDKILRIVSVPKRRFKSTQSILKIEWLCFLTEAVPRNKMHSTFVVCGKIEQF